MKTRGAEVWALGLGVVLMVCPGAKAFTFMPLVETGDAVDGTSITGLDIASANNANNELVFKAFLADGRIAFVHWVEDTLSLLVDDAGPYAFSSVNSIMELPDLNDDGVIMLDLNLDAGGNHLALGTVASPFQKTLALSSPGTQFIGTSLNNNGQVLANWRASTTGEVRLYSPTEPGSDYLNGLYTVEVLQSTETSDYFGFGVYNDINDAGHIAFAGGIDIDGIDSASRLAYFFPPYSAPGQPISIEQAGGPSEPMTLNSLIDVNASGNLAYGVVIDDDGTLKRQIRLYHADTGIIDHLATFSEETALLQVALTDDDQIVITVFDETGSGMYIVGEDALTPLLESGDSLFDSTITGLGFSRNALHGSGLLSFVYALANGLVGYASTMLSPSLTGDLNGDGFVGQDDLNIILSAWGTNVTPGDPLAGDPSGDGFVGQDDLNDVLGNWGQGEPPSVLIPEPTALALLTLGALLMKRRRSS